MTVVNVKDYGAKGDQVTDDGASVAAAIDAFRKSRPPLWWIDKKKKKPTYTPKPSKWWEDKGKKTTDKDK